MESNTVWVLGQPFLRRWYSVYDNTTDGGRIGFAHAANTAPNGPIAAQMPFVVPTNTASTSATSIPFSSSSLANTPQTGGSPSPGSTSAPNNPANQSAGGNDPGSVTGIPLLAIILPTIAFVFLVAALIACRVCSARRKSATAASGTALARTSFQQPGSAAMARASAVPSVAHYVPSVPPQTHVDSMLLPPANPAERVSWASSTPTPGPDGGWRTSYQVSDPRTSYPQGPVGHSSAYLDPHAAYADPRASYVDPRASYLDQRGAPFLQHDPRSSYQPHEIMAAYTSDPRASYADPRVSHQPQPYNSYQLQEMQLGDPKLGGALFSPSSPVAMYPDATPVGAGASNGGASGSATGTVEESEVETWGCEDVVRWLEEKRFSARTVKIFLAHGIDGPALLKLTRLSIGSDMGITSDEITNDLVDAIDELRNRAFRSRGGGGVGPASAVGGGGIRGQEVGPPAYESM
ncbi:hypothetical protein HK101_007161 [Irineochytrium annulatum]|nr:hypothetical protein HK101_007161 [Irineochytrium annulatum]